MENVLKNSWNMLKITTTMQTNSFITLLRKIPLLEQLVPVSLYRRYKGKLLFTLGGLIKGLLGNFLGTTVWCLLTLSWIPSCLQLSASKEELLLLCILVISFAPMLRSCSIFRAGEEDYVFLNHFMMNPAEYYHYKIGKEVLEDAITLVPVLTYLLQDGMLVVLAVLANVFFTLAGCCLHLFLYDRLHNMVKRWIRTMMSYGSMLAAYYGTKAGLFAGIEFSVPLCAGLCIVWLSGSVLCYLRLLHYKDYKRIAVQFANKESMLVVSIIDTAEEGRDALSKFSWERNRAFCQKNEGLDTASYLNRAFFERFRHMFKNQRQQIFLISILLGILVGWLIQNGVLEVTAETILNYTPLLIVLVNSVMLFGQRFTTLCFRFADMPLLYHGVCKPEYVKKSIQCRYVFLLEHSLVSLSGLTVFIGLVLLISGVKITTLDFLFLLLSMELFMMTQELYHLLVYYWIQPYTADVSVRSPVFTVLGAVEGVFDISLLFIRGNLALACVPLAGIFLVMNLLLVVMSKRVHKTFRLRY